MMKVHKKFGKVLHFLSEYSGFAKFTYKSDGLLIEAYSPDMYSGIALNFDRDYFGEYDIEDEVEHFIEDKKIYELYRFINLYGEAEIEIGNEYILRHKNTMTKLKKIIYKPVEEFKKLPAIKLKAFNIDESKFEMMHKLLKLASKKAGFIPVFWLDSSNDLCMIVRTEAYEDYRLKLCGAKEKLLAQYPAEFLYVFMNMVKTQNGLVGIVFEYDTDMPLRATFKGNGYNLCMMIAPRIEEE